MPTKILTPCLSLLLLLAQAPVAHAQEAPAAPRQWATITGVAQGEKLEVELRSGKTVKGRTWAEWANRYEVNK